MTFLEFFAPYITVAILSAVLGWAIARSKTRKAYELEFLYDNGYSLQCVQGVNGDDDEWGVTDRANKLVGRTAFTPRGAIDSAIGHVAFEHEAVEA